jgi:hypothetical protein
MKKKIVTKFLVSCLYRCVCLLIKGGGGNNQTHQTNIDRKIDPVMVNERTRPKPKYEWKALNHHGPLLMHERKKI